MHFFSSLLRMERYPLHHFTARVLQVFQHSAGLPNPTWAKHTAQLSFTHKVWNETSGWNSHIHDTALFGNRMFSLKKMLTAKKTFTFHNDHQRDIYNSLAHILLCVWYTAQLDTSASPLKLESHSHEAPVAGSDLSSLGHTWSSTWILGHTSHSLVSAVSLESSGLSWTSSSSSSQPHPHRGGQFHLLVSH